MAVQLVNWGSTEKPAKLVLTGAEARGAANVTVLASPHRLDTNTLDEPNKVGPCRAQDVELWAQLALKHMQRSGCLVVRHAGRCLICQICHTAELLAVPSRDCQLPACQGGLGLI